MAETLKRQRITLSEVSGKRFVELLYAESAEIDDDSPCVLIRLPVQQDYPILPEARLEALQRVRKLVDDEIQEIERERGRAGATWQ